MSWDTFSDGFTDIQRNCGCGGVYVLVNEYVGKCGMCNSEKFTQAGLNVIQSREREAFLRKIEEERAAYNAEHPDEA
jgi:hypothetical protein